MEQEKIKLITDFADQKLAEYKQENPETPAKETLCVITIVGAGAGGEMQIRSLAQQKIKEGMLVVEIPEEIIEASGIREEMRPRRPLFSEEELLPTFKLEASRMYSENVHTYDFATEERRERKFKRTIRNISNDISTGLQTGTLKTLAGDEIL